MHSLNKSRIVMQAALSQGSLDNIPLGPLATLMPLLQMAGVLNDPAIKSALKQVLTAMHVMSDSLGWYMSTVDCLLTCQGQPAIIMFQAMMCWRLCSCW